MKGFTRCLAGLPLFILIVLTCFSAGNAHAASSSPQKIELTPHVTGMGGAVFDRDGNLLVGDADADLIYKFDPKGKLLMKFGGHGQGDGQFQFWNDSHQANGGYAAADAQGNIFVADTGNDRIQKFDSKGKFLKKWGKSGNNDGEFSQPYAISTDAQGNVYVSDMQTWRVQKFNNDGKLIQVIKKQNTASSGEQPWLCNTVDRAGNIYIGTFNGNVRKFDPAGRPITDWGKGIKNIKACFHLAVDAGGNLYVSDATPRVIKIDPSGKVLGTFDMPKPQPPDTAAVSTAIDSKGALYVGFNTWNGKVWDTSIFVFQPGDLKPLS